MIEKIKYENDTLCIYLDYNYEFGNFKNFGKDLRNSINKILNKEVTKKKKINRIKIICGTILVANLLIVPTAKENIITYVNPNSANKIIDRIDIDDNYIVNSTIEDITNNIVNNNEHNVNDNIDSNVKENIKIDKISANEKNTNTNTIKVDSIDNSTSVKNIDNTINIEVNNIDDKTNNSIDSNVNNNINDNTGNSINTNLDNKTYVQVYKNNEIINMELEEYITLVVSSEMPASFDKEALKAQAIVARTYALKRISEGKILTSTTSTQVCKSIEELKSSWGNNFDKYYNKVKNAVKDTEGMYITYKGKYIDAVYHSTSNGYTEDASKVWGNSIEYLKSVDSSWDKNVGSYKKDLTMSYSTISNKLGIIVTSDSIISYDRNLTNRIDSINIDNNIFSGTDIRSKLGLRSTDFIIELNDDNVTITTYGYGHGVGMSQYGANEMAKLGYSYSDIIHHYYTNVKIDKR